MKVATFGKGGSGKTTIAVLLARTAAARGLEVVALDCDSNPNLGITLGLGADGTETLAGIRQSLDGGETEHAPTLEEMLVRFGAEAPAGIRLAVVTKIEKPDPG